MQNRPADPLAENTADRPQITSRSPHHGIYSVAAWRPDPGDLQ